MKKNRKRRRGRTKARRRERKRTQLKNKRLIKKYYWLRPTDWMGCPRKDYDYTWIEWGCGKGWDKAFGQMYMDELGEAIKEIRQKDFSIVEIKEKYGMERVYCSGTSDKAHKIIDKYEEISQHICYYCGVEAPMTNDGWILPQCYDCFRKVYKRYDQYFYYVEKTEEEIQQRYKDIIIDEPDNNGEYHIPDTYKVNHYSNGEKSIIEYDISDTAEKIRKRISKFKKIGG